MSFTSAINKSTLHYLILFLPFLYSFFLTIFCFDCIRPDPKSELLSLLFYNYFTI